MTQSDATAVHGFPAALEQSQNDDAADAEPAPATGPRRSSLAQDRSRRTREALVDAAFAIWAERGFETGIETTTVEEIARAAGVTKGTFYFHFARKVDVILELERANDGAMTAALHAALGAGAPIDVAVQRALAVTAERMERMPRAALAQLLREYHRSPGAAREKSPFRNALVGALDAARGRRELPADVDAERMASLVAASIVAANEAWADGRSDDLAGHLDYGVRVVFAGVRAEHAHRTRPR